MHFLYPNMLFGLFAVSIPVVIHLLNIQRYKKIYFTQTNLIADLQKQSRRRSTLRQWIILFLRILAIVMLVMAFSGPVYSPLDDLVGEGEYVSIYLDNSYSMGARKEDGHLLHVARRKAEALVMSFDVSARFQVLTNDFHGRHQRWLSQEQALEAIEETRFSPAFRTLGQAFQRQHQLISNTPGIQPLVYVISDFQSSMYDLEQDHEIPDTSARYTFLPVRAPQLSNVYIDSVWFTTPVLFQGQRAGLNVRITNQGNRETVPLRLFLNNTQRLVINADFQGQKQNVFSLNFGIRNTGLHYGRLELSDHGLEFDNTFYFRFQVPRSVDVLVISDSEAPNRYLQAYFKGDSLVNTTFYTLSTLDYQSLPAYSSIILDGLESIPSGLASALDEQVASGSSLVIFPAHQAGEDTYNPFLSRFDQVRLGEEREQEMSVREMAWEGDVFQGIFQTRSQTPDYPVVFRDRRLTYTLQAGARQLLTLEDRSPMLLEITHGKGNVYLFSVECSEKSSNFVGHWLFSVLYNMVLEGVQTGRLYHIAGATETYTNQNVELIGDEVPVLRDINSEKEIIPRIIHSAEGLTFVLDGQIKESGIWGLFYRDEKVDALAFNYDGRESDIQMSDIEAEKPRWASLMKESPETIGMAIEREKKGYPLWPFFIVAALLFLLGETALLRWWKL